MPHRGWPGERPIPFKSYDGAVVLLKEPLDPIRRRELSIGTGFAGLKALEAAAFEPGFGFPPPPGIELLELRVIGSAAKGSNLRQLSNRLRGRPLSYSLWTGWNCPWLPENGSQSVATA